MVELCSAVSGEVLVQLAAIDVEEQVVKVLKRHFGVDIWMEEISRNLKVFGFSYCKRPEMEKMTTQQQEERPPERIQKTWSG